MKIKPYHVAMQSKTPFSKDEPQSRYESIQNSVCIPAERISPSPLLLKGELCAINITLTNPTK